MQSVAHGKKYGLVTVFGLISGCIIHTTLLAFGVSAIIKNSDNLFFIIKMFGAGYLLYLAYHVFRSSGDLSISENQVPKKSLGQLYKQGFIMNVLNPKVSIFFLAFFPGFLFSETMSTIWQFYILGFVFMGVSLLIFSAIAILAGSISVYIKSHKQIGVILKWLQIFVFIGIAILILV